MNKFLTLVFLGLLLIILSFSTKTTRRDSTAHRAAPAGYAGRPATARPAGRSALDNRVNAGSRLLVATQR